MILVDTSVWVDHLRSGDTELAALLEGGAVLAHTWVIGELALGSLTHRSEVSSLLEGLPRAVVADEAELMTLIEQQSLSGSGIGYVDAQLLAATRLTPDSRLWTRDKRLAAVSARLGVGHRPRPSS